MIFTTTRIERKTRITFQKIKDIGQKIITLIYKFVSRFLAYKKLIKSRKNENSMCYLFWPTYYSSPYFFSHFLIFFLQNYVWKISKFFLERSHSIKKIVYRLSTGKHTENISVSFCRKHGLTHFFSFTDFSSFSSRFLFFSHFRTPNIENRFLHNLFTRFFSGTGPESITWQFKK